LRALGVVRQIGHVFHDYDYRVSASEALRIGKGPGERAEKLVAHADEGWLGSIGHKRGLKPAPHERVDPMTGAHSSVHLL
jgi:hypothetical protein